MSCSVWILVARTDIPFMMKTIPHLIKTCNFPFEEKVLAVDTAPLTGDKVNRPGIGSLSDLYHCTQELLANNVVDRVVNINYDPSYHEQVYQKHFGTRLVFSHNYKGYPILGSIFTIEECKSDYMLHFDSDMLLYQAPNYNWIEAAINIMESHPELSSIRPLTGPPRADGKMIQNKPYEWDLAGFYKYRFFSSRVYLINKKRFDQLLPLPLIFRPYRNPLINRLPTSLKVLYSNLSHKGSIDSWEIMVSQQNENLNFFRGVLSNPHAWTIHPPHHNAEFIAALPSLIERIELGNYPLEQAGHYDLKLELW